MERVNDLKEFNMKTNHCREISVVGQDSLLLEASIYLKNTLTDEEVGITLSRSELKTLIIALMAMGNFKEDDFKEKYHRYQSPDFFGYPSSSDARFLYQNIRKGNIFLQSEVRFDTFMDKDMYKSRFTDKEFEVLLESNPEISVLIKETIDIN